MSEEPANLPAAFSSSDMLGREHARQDAMQEELLRHAYKRSVHRSYIEAALRRTGHTVLSRESANAFMPRIRTVD